MNTNRLDPSDLGALRALDSCRVANAIETFSVRLRNTGFADSSIHCVFPDLPPTVGYAATARIRTSEPPMEGDGYCYRLDWIEHLLSIPVPRVLVLQDMDSHPGLGSFVGDVHANILRAVGCIGLITNGAVRNVNEIHGLQFQLFAGNLSVSHAFAHIVDFGMPVEVGGMAVRPGDLIHGDLHGVQTVPLEIAHKLPAMAHQMFEQEQEIIQSTHANFSLERLRIDIAVLHAKRESKRGT